MLSCACCSSESELASAESSDEPMGPAATLCFSSCSTYDVHSRKNGPRNFASAFLCFLNSSLRGRRRGRGVKGERAREEKEEVGARADAPHVAVAQLAHAVGQPRPVHAQNATV